MQVNRPQAAAPVLQIPTDQSRWQMMQKGLIAGGVYHVMMPDGGRQYCLWNGRQLVPCKFAICHCCYCCLTLCCMQSVCGCKKIYQLTGLTYYSYTNIAISFDWYIMCSPEKSINGRWMYQSWYIVHCTANHTCHCLRISWFSMWCVCVKNDSPCTHRYLYAIITTTTTTTTR